MQQALENITAVELKLLLNWLIFYNAGDCIHPVTFQINFKGRQSKFLINFKETQCTQTKAKNGKERDNGHGN